MPVRNFILKVMSESFDPDLDPDPSKMSNKSNILNIKPVGIVCVLKKETINTA